MELLEIFEFDLLECLKIIFKTPQLTNFLYFMEMYDF